MGAGVTVAGVRRGPHGCWGHSGGARERSGLVGAMDWEVICVGGPYGNVRRLQSRVGLGMWDAERFQVGRVGRCLCRWQGSVRGRVWSEAQFMKWCTDRAGGRWSRCIGRCMGSGFGMSMERCRGRDLCRRTRGQCGHKEAPRRSNGGSKELRRVSDGCQKYTTKMLQDGYKDVTGMQ